LWHGYPAVNGDVVYLMVCPGPCGIGSKALPDAVPLETGMVLSDGQFLSMTFIFHIQLFDRVLTSFAVDYWYV